MLMLCAWSASAVRGSALFAFPAQNREETRQRFGWGKCEDEGQHGKPSAVKCGYINPAGKRRGDRLTDGCSKLQQQYAVAGVLSVLFSWQERSAVVWFVSCGHMYRKGKAKRASRHRDTGHIVQPRALAPCAANTFLVSSTSDAAVCPKTKTDAASIGHALVRGHANQWIPLATAPSISIKTRATDASQPCVALMPDVYGAHTSRQTGTIQ